MRCRNSPPPSHHLATNGGPNHGTYLMGVKIYEDAFQNLKMGYASASSWVMFVAILLITLLVFRSSSAWVFYNDGEWTDEVKRII